VVELDQPFHQAGNDINFAFFYIAELQIRGYRRRLALGFRPGTHPTVSPLPTTLRRGKFIVAKSLMVPIT
jgi:hypothetical protein